MKTINPFRRALIAIVVLAVCAGLPAWSQAPEEPEGGVAPEADPELREAVRKFFYQRLRSTLSLTDEQMAAVVPRLEEIEGKRDEIRSQRREITRSLHRGLEGGMGDEELQALLTRYDDVAGQELDLAAGAFTEIDPELTVRQRVQLRFFLQQFQERMKRRIEEIRRGGPEGRRRPPQGGGGQWNQQP